MLTLPFVTCATMTAHAKAGHNPCSQGAVMNHQETPVLVEPNSALLRIIPKRVEVMGRRLQRFLQDGWDINGLASLQDDAHALTNACVEQELLEPAESLQAMAGLLDATIEQQELPDPTVGERLRNLMDSLQAALPIMPDDAQDMFAGRERLGDSTARAEIPPMAYWRRWGNDAPPIIAVQASIDTFKRAPAGNNEVIDANDPWSDKGKHHGNIEHADVFTENDYIEPSESMPTTKLEIVSTTVGNPSSSPVPIAEPITKSNVSNLTPVLRSIEIISNNTLENLQLPVPSSFRIYHLTAYSELSVALDQRFESQGLEIELVEDIDELKELLSALPADLVIVDAEFGQQLEALGQDIRAIRQKQARKLKLVALSDADDINLRLSARRAGVDALIVGAKSVVEVIKRLHSLLDPGSERPYRILIVEDDRSQALFAEGILRNTGMETLVVLDALEVMPALEQFQPDLLLMDLNMPGANGIELTSLIREQEAFMHTPIVFLSGESDEDRQFDAIDAGGDDFLSKPIRPRHLISAVQNRVRRHRAMENRQPKRIGANAQTGLYDRQDLMALINHHLQQSADRKGGVLLLEMEGLSSLRERYGIAAFEQLQQDVVRVLAKEAVDCPIGRFGDGSYLIYASKPDEATLVALAQQCRTSLVQHEFEMQTHPLKLRASVGVCAFSHAFNDSGAMLNAVEKVTRDARTNERGVRQYEPPKAEDALREAALLKQVREAIAQQSLELLYQPVVAVAGSDDSQYQTLLRLRDSNGNLLSAAEVIPMAERSDLIVDIDRWVLIQALALIRDRRAEQRPMRLFVTQSPLTLADSSQAEWLKSELADNDVPGASLVIELRMEDASIHVATVRQFCDSLVSLGVQFCLSQFELNAETERLLEQLPLGFVKLARKYSMGIQAQSTRDELKTLIGRAHRRGLEVIGTGVEDPQAAATLWMSGIDFIQGNLVQEADSGLDFDFQQAVL
jgi:EAL domain-containing protein (putative c-di-GMP-specific phosphodiesterase class I)/DNA-binding response OmpR family regulator